MASEGQHGFDLSDAEELARSLGEALSSGDCEEAVELCRKLSKLNAPVCVNIKSEVYPKDSIRLKVGVEDADSDCYIPVTVMVSSAMTIAELKEKFHQDFGFHPQLQRWVIGKRLALDQQTLHNYGVRKSGDQAFLFILSAHAADLTRHQHNRDQEQQRIDGIVESMQHVQIIPRGHEGGSADRTTAAAASVMAKPAPPLVVPKPKLGWACVACTFFNKPTRPGCEMCGEARPDGYKVPDIYQPDQAEAQRLEQERLALLQYEQAQLEERERNYMNLLETDELKVVPNLTEVDCPICFVPLKPGEGIVLRECLHTFCRDCLVGTIQNSCDAEVSCPENCESKLLDREIRELLTDDEHQRFLEKRLSIAESRSDHSFHCQTPNCRGWCIYEDEVNEFDCEICKAVNCILCRAIHTNMNCKDYQEDLRIRAENDQAAQQTKQMLERMLQNGEAMTCPQCDIIVQKKDGCDWICCLMCRTEICWVTKQARWGPKGNGDTSGGCRCRVNFQPCHPNCQNCH